MTLACEIEEINKLTKLTNTSSDKDVAEAYLDYTEWKNKASSSAAYQFGVKQDKALADKISKIKDHPLWKEAVCSKAQEYLKQSKEANTHKERRDLIEDAMRLLKEFIESKKDMNCIGPATYTLIAKAYLMRSQIIRPKGLTIPEKKKDAINKGIAYADNALKINESDTDALRIKAQLCLELDKLRSIPEDKLSGALEAVLLNTDSSFEDINDAKIALRYSELNKQDTRYIDAIVKSTMPGIEFEKARAYKLLGKGNEIELTKVFKDHINKLEEEHFSNPLWDETVLLLKDLREEKFERWKELSLAAWDACYSVEKNMQSPLHIRWYWSKMRDLYDLAFTATEDLHKKVEIADSLKSRPALRWNTIEETAKNLSSKKKEELDKLIEDYAKALDGGYLKQMPRQQGSKVDDAASRKITDMPEGWAVIHFYLNQLEKKGYAIIAGSQDPTKWKIKDFEYAELFDAYMEWQTNYTRYKQGAADYLVKLCEKIGEKMPFLFDGSIPENSKVLFIPHDFLHRLPLHGAIKDGKVFLENHANCYLPAWEYAKQKQDVGKGDIKYLFKHFPEWPYDKLTDIAWSNKEIMDDATPENIKKIHTAPELLVLLCHGKADAVNPFNARLMLKDKAMTHLELSRSEINLKGTKVVLGACETELVPSLSDIIDEHLSIATAFLNKGASEIMGTMWKVQSNWIETLVLLTSNKGSQHFYKIVQEWQRNKINDWKRSKEAIHFYDCLPFRAINTTIL